MKGRDLIIFILQNGLEDEDIFVDNFLDGFMTIEEAAVKLGVGQATVEVWCHCNAIDHMRLGDRFYIHPDAKRPIASSVATTPTVVNWKRVT